MLNQESGPSAPSDAPTGPLAALPERDPRTTDPSAAAATDRIFGADAFMALPSPTALLAPSGIVTAVNDAWRRLTGDDAAGDVGRPLWRRFAPAERSHLVALVERVRDIAEAAPVVAGTQIHRTDGRPVDVALRLSTSHGRHVALLAQLEPITGRHLDGVRRPGTGDRQVALATIARSVSMSTGIASISESVISAVARATGCPLVALWRRMDRWDGFQFVDGLGFGPGARGSLVLEGHAGGLAAHTIRSRSVVVIGGPTGTAAQMPRVLMERGVSSGVAVPIHGFAGGDGLLTVSATHNQPMDPEDVRFLAIVGDLLTMAAHREGVDELIAGERRRTAAVTGDLEQLRRRYLLAIDLAGIRDWVWTRPRCVTTDRRVEPPPHWPVQTCLDGGPQAIVDCAVTDDADDVARAINVALADGDALDISARVHTTGGVVTLCLRGTIDRDERLDVRQIAGLATVTTSPGPPSAAEPHADHERLARTAHDLSNLLAAMLGTAEQLAERGAHRRQLTAIVHAGRRARGLLAGLRHGHDDPHPRVWAADRPPAGGDLERVWAADRPPAGGDLERVWAADRPPAGGDLERVWAADRPPADAELSAYELADVVEPLRPLLRGLVGSDAHLRFELGRDARALRPRREDVERILLDLVGNSADAIADDGTVVIATDAYVRYDRATDSDVPPAGRWARLRVRDDGTGMASSARAQVFAPGFSTKPQPQHGGLGLAAVHEIVSGAGGVVRIDSAPSRGTVIDVYLPLAAEPAVRLQPLRPAALPRGVDSAAVPASRVALVADDEPALRELLRELLGRLGFEVTVAADGAAALDAAHRLDRLDLLVSDLTMPHLDGLELSRRVRDLHARAAVLLLSGAPAATPVADRDLRVLRKPFEWGDLADAVMGLLRTEPRPAELEAHFPAASG